VIPLNYIMQLCSLETTFMAYLVLRKIAFRRFKNGEMKYVIKFPHVYVVFRVRTTWITFSALPPPELLCFETKPRLAITSGKQAIHRIIFDIYLKSLK